MCSEGTRGAASSASVDLLDRAQSELYPAVKPLRHTISRQRQVSFAMRSDPPLSHEIRYVFSVHGGILIAGVAMLLRNVSLMAKLRLGSDRPRDHGSFGISLRRFPAIVTEPQGDCPACSPERTTRPRRLLQNVDDRFEERSSANLRYGVERRLVPGP